MTEEEIQLQKTSTHEKHESEVTDGPGDLQELSDGVPYSGSGDLELDIEDIQYGLQELGDEDDNPVHGHRGSGAHGQTSGEEAQELGDEAAGLHSDRKQVQFSLPSDKKAATRFLNQKYKTILRCMRSMEDSLDEGATGYLYFKPKYGEARQIVTQNVPLDDLSRNMKREIFINEIETLAKNTETTFEIRNKPITDPSWKQVRVLLDLADGDCLKKLVRAVKHLFAGIHFFSHRIYYK